MTIIIPNNNDNMISNKDMGTVWNACFCEKAIGGDTVEGQHLLCEGVKAETFQHQGQHLRVALRLVVRQKDHIVTFGARQREAGGIGTQLSCMLMTNSR